MQIYLCFLFVVFAMVNWASVVSMAKSLFVGDADVAAEAYSRANAAASQQASAASAADGFAPHEGDSAAAGDTICNPHQKTCVNP